MDAGFVATFLNLASVIVVWRLLWGGLLTTLTLVVAIIPAAMVLGLGLAVIRNLRIPVLGRATLVYIDLLRSFPPLVLLVFLYSGLPFAGVRLSELQTVVVGLILNGAAFFGEICRAGLESVPAGQREAGRSTGLGAWQVMAWIVIPQGLRNVVPPLASNVVELTRATSLAAAVSLPDLLTSARQGQDIVHNPTPLVAAALIYLLWLWPLVRLLSRLEARMMARAA